MLKKHISKIITILAGLIILFVCYSAFSIWTFGAKNKLVKTDAAIVLGAAVWGDQPSPVLRERILHAIWLYENGYVSKIIFTGGKGDIHTMAESEAARKYAIEHHVNSDDILIETISTITEENLKYAYNIANQNGLKTFTIVSDPLHMKRSMVMAHHLGMEAYTSPTSSSVYTSLKTKLPFFLRELFFYIGYLLSIPFR